MSDIPIYGVLAEFRTPDEIVQAVRQLNAHGYTQLESYTPFAVEGVPEALHFALRLSQSFS